MATSPPTTSAKASGTVVVDALEPATQLTIATDGGPVTDRIELNVAWTATSESGIEPELSVTTLGSTLATGRGVPLSEVQIDTPEAALEFSVANIDETGTVTIEWQANASLEGDDVELSVTASTKTGAPSSAVSLPAIHPSFSRMQSPFAVFIVETEFDSSGAVTIERTDQIPNSYVQAITGGSLLAIGPGVTNVPIDGAACVADRCSMTFTLASTAYPRLRIEVSDGSITAVTRQPETTTTWLTLPPLRLASEVTDLSIDVAMPDDPQNPFAAAAILVTRVPDDSDPITHANCFAPVEFSLAGQPFAELVSFVSDEVGGESLALADGSTTRIDLRLGTTDPGQYCGIDSDNETELEVGVMTIGLGEVLPANVTLP